MLKTTANNRRNYVYLLQKFIHVVKNGLYICAIANQPRDHLLHTCNAMCKGKKHFHHKKGLPKTTPNECLETLRVICLSWRQHASGHLAGDGGNESCTPTAPFF